MSLLGQIFNPVGPLQDATEHQVDPHADWLQGMRLAGAAIMLTGIAVALYAITLVMRFLGERMGQVAAEAIEQD